MHVASPRPWLFLLVSAAFEVVWIVSLKLTDGFVRLGPLLVYAVSNLQREFYSRTFAVGFRWNQ